LLVGCRVRLWCVAPNQRLPAEKPMLQKRGIFRTEYSGSTLGEMDHSRESTVETASSEKASASSW